LGNKDGDGSDSSDSISPNLTGKPSPSTRWPGLSARAVDNLAHQFSGLKTGSAAQRKDAIRTRLAKSVVPAEAIGAEVEKVVRRIEALGGDKVAPADPPVKAPDPLDGHGAPHPAGPHRSNGVEPGLRPYRIRELAIWYIEEAARRLHDPNLAAVGALQDAIDGDLRQRLTELGVSPEFMATEFERVMQVAFAV